MPEDLPIVDAAPLAPFTTLELGGPARHLAEATSPEMVVSAVSWANSRGLPVLVLGGGSNVVVSDSGFDGLVLRMAVRGLRFQSDGDRVVVQAAAGESWDDLVRTVVARGWAGVECLAGIPGLVGATPIQNVGAYGQEVAETIREVTVLERSTGRVVELPGAACQFGYRDSLFKRHPDAYVVLSVTFTLTPGGAPCLRYRELEAAVTGLSVSASVSASASASVSAPGPAPAPAGLVTLAGVSDAVRALRRKKSMVLAPDDPNRRSVGSFFTNPVLAPDAAAAVVSRALAGGTAAAPSEVPQFPAPAGLVKLSAGWLVERSGFAKGFRRGNVGVSSNHALALVHHGGGTASELWELAQDIQRAVGQRFGVALAVEPVWVGAAPPEAPLR